MAIGRNFTEALQKALRSLEKRGAPFHWGGEPPQPRRASSLEQHARPRPTAGSCDVQQALRGGRDGRAAATRRPSIDPWFLDQIVLLNEVAAQRRATRRTLDAGRPARAPSGTASRDAQIGAAARHRPRTSCARCGTRSACRPVYKTVDTCAAEFAGHSRRTTTRPTTRRPRSRRATARKVVILGSGPEPDRPGHRVRLLVRARRVRAARRRLRDHHGQLQPRDRLDRLRHQRPALLRAADARGRARGRPRRARSRRRSSASSCSSAARPPLGLAQAPRGRRRARSSAPARRRSTSPRSAALFGRVLADAGLPAPAARHRDRASSRRRRSPSDIGYPVLVRPSATCSAAAAWRSSTTSPALADYFERVAGQSIVGPEHPLLVDRFLDDAIEIDVDALFDGTELYLGGVMEHIEEAGIHSGDSALRAAADHARRAARSTGCATATEAIAEGVGVRGLLNVQFALGAGVLYVLEANPRASPHRAVRVQGDRRPAGQGRRRGSWWAPRIAELRAEGLLPRAATAATLPARRAASRSRRRCCRSSGSAPRRARSSTRCSARRCARPARSWASTRTSRTAFAKSQAAAYGGLPTVGPGLRLGRRPRQARDGLPGQAARRARLRDRSRPRAPPRCCAATASPATVVRKHSERPGRRTASRRSSTCINAGEVDIVVNTPQRAGGARSTATRSAPPPRRRQARSSRRCSSWPPPSLAIEAAIAADGRVERPVAAGARPLPRPGARGRAGMSRLDRSVLLPPVELATAHDAEVALHLHLRAMSALQASPALLRRGGTPARCAAGPAAGPGADGRPAVPAPVRGRGGLDKNGAVYPAFEAHFTPGFVEVGTVTLRAAGRQPAAPGVPAAGRPPAQRDGLPQPGRGRGGPQPARPARRRRCRWASTWASPRPPRTPPRRASTPRCAPRSAGWGSAPRTTTSSTSPRRTRPGCAPCRRSGGSGRSSTP